MHSTLFTAGRYSHGYSSSIASTGTYRILHGLSNDPGLFPRLFHVYTYSCRYGPMPILIGRRDTHVGPSTVEVPIRVQSVHQCKCEMLYGLHVLIYSVIYMHDAVTRGGRLDGMVKIWARSACTPCKLVVAVSLRTNAPRPTTAPDLVHRSTSEALKHRN